MATPQPQKPSVGFFNEIVQKVERTIHDNHFTQVDTRRVRLAIGLNFGASTRVAANFIQRVLDKLVEAGDLIALGGTPKRYKVIQG